jgi:site-specific recombinase XerD
MQMNGVDPTTIGKILGHKDVETAMIYTDQTDEHLKSSIGKTDIR